MSLTEKEKMMLNNFKNDEYLGGDMSSSTWSWNVCQGIDGACGVMSSLVKKDLAWTQYNYSDDDMCGLTEKGREVLKTLEV